MKPCCLQGSAAHAGYAALACLLLMGCGKPFEVRTAPGFVEVHEEQPQYDYRAVAPDGVAVAVRMVAAQEHTDLGFWERAVALRMRELEGYALLESREIRGANGSVGRELVFGHDEDGKPFVYRVRLLLSGEKLLVVEAGGSADQMKRWKASVDWMLDSVGPR